MAWSLSQLQQMAQEAIAGGATAQQIVDWSVQNGVSVPELEQVFGIATGGGAQAAKDYGVSQESFQGLLGGNYASQNTNWSQPAPAAQPSLASLAAPPKPVSTALPPAVGRPGDRPPPLVAKTPAEYRAYAESQGYSLQDDGHGGQRIIDLQDRGGGGGVVALGGTEGNPRTLDEWLTDLWNTDHRNASDGRELYGTAGLGRTGQQTVNIGGLEWRRMGMEPANVPMNLRAGMQYSPEFGWLAHPSIVNALYAQQSQSQRKGGFWNFMDSIATRMPMIAGMAATAWLTGPGLSSLFSGGGEFGAGLASELGIAGSGMTAAEGFAALGITTAEEAAAAGLAEAWASAGPGLTNLPSNLGTPESSGFPGDPGNQVGNPADQLPAKTLTGPMPTNTLPTNTLPTNTGPTTPTKTLPTDVLKPGPSTLANLLSGNPSDDLLKLLGTLGGTGLGLLGANSQADAIRDASKAQIDASREMSERYLGLGQPYRDRLNATYQPGWSLENEPGFTNAMDVAGKGAANALSTKYGNPAESPGATAELNKYLLGNFALPQLNTTRSQLGTFGQLGVSQAGSAGMSGISAAPGTAASSGPGMYNALGYGLAGLTAPNNDLASLMRQFGISNMGT